MGISKTSGGQASARLSSSTLRAVHELFVAGQVDASYLDSTPLRRVVAESWRRSLATGVDPRPRWRAARRGGRLDGMRASHPLAPALPVIRRLTGRRRLGRRRRRRRDRSRRHAAVGRGRPQCLPQGRTDELRARRRLE